MGGWIAIDPLCPPPRVQQPQDKTVGTAFAKATGATRGHSQMRKTHLLPALICLGRCSG